MTRTAALRDIPSGLDVPGQRRPPGLTARWMLHHLRTPLVKNAFYLVCSAGLTSALGSVFWLAAARLYLPNAIGLASAGLSALLLLAALCDLGLDYAQMRFGAADKLRAGDIANLAFTLGGLATLLGSVVFLAGLHVWSPALGTFFSRVPAGLLLFVAMAPLATAGNLLDATLIGQGRASLVLTKNVTTNALRFPIALGLASMGALGLFLGISLPVALVPLVGLMLLRHVLPGYRCRPSLDLVLARRLLPYGVKNHIVNIVSSLPTFLLPMIVVNILGAAAAGYFAIAWLIMTPIMMAQASISSALLSEGARQGDLYMREVRRAVSLVVPGIALAAGLGMAAAPFLLSIFTPAYTQHASDLLRLLLLATVPGCINSVFQSRCRIEGRTAPIFCMALASAGLTLVLAIVLLSRSGLAGAGLAVLAGQLVVVPYAAVMVLRRPGP